MDTARLDSWWAGGRIERIDVGGTARDVFIREDGAGPVVTLLHGFPASSFEWAAVVEPLAEHHRVVTVDFLGYGRSAKPRGHRYRLDEQAELVVAVWRRLGVDSTSVLAYDYGAIIAQLLVLHPDRPELTRVLFENAGLIPELYAPRLVQRLTLAPVVGALLARGLNERAFHRSWAAVFGADHPLEAQTAHEHYVALRHDDPARDVQRRLLRYIPDRAAMASRLDQALDGRVPLSFLWGLADPVSGARIADGLVARDRGIDLVRYEGVGHCPHLEIPDRVAADVLARTTASG